MKVTIPLARLISIDKVDFLKSREQANRLEYVDETGSTNTDLVAAATANPSEYPHLSVLIAGSQSAGRGRSGRLWVSPKDKSLAISVLVRPKFPIGEFGWLPLFAGVAMRQAIADFGLAKHLEIKWPNDLLIDDRKVCGILSELLPDGSGVVIGAGINLTLEKEELPIETATSLHLEGLELAPDALVSGYLSNLESLLADVENAKGFARKFCATVGRNVKALLPDGSEVFGTAMGVADDARLLIQVTGQPELFAVSAGDVTHLRHN